MLWRYVARPLLFALPTEWVHHLSMDAFHAMMFPPLSSMARRWTQVSDPRLQVSALGIPFANPIGLAAGFDKQAAWFNSLSCLGFSHIEVGTITARPQPGNPKPRLFRLPADRALVNRMGFNNAGAEATAAAVSKQPINTVLGINIGKSKVTPLEQADTDYLTSFQKLHPYADYFAVNVSSPNTPGLRQLQDREPLLRLLNALGQENRRLADQQRAPAKPVLLKIAPDLNQSQLDDIVAIAKETEIAGIIATNTTISRHELKSTARRLQRAGEGGLSGGPLTQLSRGVVRHLYQRLENEIPIIGVGGIMCGADAWQMISAGATLVQVYTGFIYGGPFFVNRINRYLLEKLDQLGLESIQQAVGRQA